MMTLFAQKTLDTIRRKPLEEVKTEGYISQLFFVAIKYYFDCFIYICVIISSHCR